MKKTAYILICLIICCLIFFCGWKVGSGRVTHIVTTDTLTIVKIQTVRYDEPTLVSKSIDEVDIAPVPLLPEFNPIEFDLDIDYGSFDYSIMDYMRVTKVYQDSTYTAQISGSADCQLDWIETYAKEVVREVYITETIKEKPKKFGLGLQLGYTYMNGKWQPYVGGGISWNFIRF